LNRFPFWDNLWPQILNFKRQHTPQLISAEGKNLSYLSLPKKIVWRETIIPTGEV